MFGEKEKKVLKKAKPYLDNAVQEKLLSELLGNDGRDYGFVERDGIFIQSISERKKVPGETEWYEEFRNHEAELKKFFANLGITDVQFKQTEEEGRGDFEGKMHHTFEISIPSASFKAAQDKGILKGLSLEQQFKKSLRGMKYDYINKDEAEGYHIFGMEHATLFKIVMEHPESEDAKKARAYWQEVTGEELKIVDWNHTNSGTMRPMLELSEQGFLNLTLSMNRLAMKEELEKAHFYPASESSLKKYLGDRMVMALDPNDKRMIGQSTDEFLENSQLPFLDQKTGKPIPFDKEKWQLPRALEWIARFNWRGVGINDMSATELTPQLWEECAGEQPQMHFVHEGEGEGQFYLSLSKEAYARLQTHFKLKEFGTWEAKPGLNFTEFDWDTYSHVSVDPAESSMMIYKMPAIPGIPEPMAQVSNECSHNEVIEQAIDNYVLNLKKVLPQGNYLKLVPTFNTLAKGTAASYDAFAEAATKHGLPHAELYREVAQAFRKFAALDKMHYTSQKLENFAEILTKDIASTVISLAWAPVAQVMNEIEFKANDSKELPWVAEFDPKKYPAMSLEVPETKKWLEENLFTLTMRQRGYGQEIYEGKRPGFRIEVEDGKGRVYLSHEAAQSLNHRHGMSNSDIPVCRDIIECMLLGHVNPDLPHWSPPGSFGIPCKGDKQKVGAPIKEYTETPAAQIDGPVADAQKALPDSGASKAV